MQSKKKAGQWRSTTRLPPKGTFSVLASSSLLEKTPVKPAATCQRKVTSPQKEEVECFSSASSSIGFENEKTTSVSRSEPQPSPTTNTPPLEESMQKSEKEPSPATTLVAFKEQEITEEVAAAAEVVVSATRKDDFPLPPDVLKEPNSKENSTDLAVNTPPAAVSNPERSSVRNFKSNSVASTAVGSPKGFEKYVEKGRLKRKSLATEMEEKARRDSVSPTFHPQITEKAKQCRAGHSASVEFLESAYAWEREKQERLQRKSVLVSEAEQKDIESAVFRNRMSTTILEKKSGGKTKNAFQRLLLDEEKRKENREALVQKYTPSFQPELTVDASPSKRAPVAVEDAERFYERMMDGRRKSIAKIEQFITEEKEKGGVAKIKKEEFELTLARMREREERRQQRLERKKLEMLETEQQALRPSPQINRDSEKLAVRARSRPAKKAVPESTMSDTTSTRKGKKVNPKAFERRQQILEQRRKERTELLILEKMASELEECTFKPVIVPFHEDTESLWDRHEEEMDSDAEGVVGEAEFEISDMDDDFSKLQETLMEWETLAVRATNN